MENFIIRHEYLNKLLAYKDKDLIKVVSGLRRSGKSTLFELFQQELYEMGIQANQIVFLNFEDFELRKYLNDLEGLYNHIISLLDLSKQSYVFLDEIQNVNEFERLVDCYFFTVYCLQMVSMEWYMSGNVYIQMPHHST